MRFLKDYKLFESEKRVLIDWDNLTYHEKVGSLLYLYGGIPISNKKSPNVIGYILNSKIGYYDIHRSKEINFNEPSHFDLHNTLRFYDYFDSLFKNPQTLGFNFEGAICGLFDGQLSNISSSKYDLIINNKKYSVKTNKNKDRFGLGSMKKLIEQKYPIYYEIILKHSIKYLIWEYLNDDDRLNFITDIFKNYNDGVEYYILSYMDKTTIAYDMTFKNYNFDQYEFNKLVDYAELYNEIYTHVISIDTMINFILKDKNSIASTKKNKFEFTLSTKIFSEPKTEKDNFIVLKYRELTNQELEKLRNITNYNKAGEIFTKQIAKKMRPDVIDHIFSNSEEIGNKLLNIKK